MSIQLAELELNISTNTNGAVASLRDLASALSELRDATKGGISGLNTIAKQLQRLSASIDGGLADKIRDIANALHGIADMGSVNISVKADTGSIKESVQQATEDAYTPLENPMVPQGGTELYRAYPEGFVEFVQGIGSAYRQSMGDADAMRMKFEEMYSTMEQAQPMSADDVLNMSELEILKYKLDVLKAKLQDALDAGDQPEKAINLTMQIKRLQEQITKLENPVTKTKSIFKDFFKSLKRIATYRIVSSILKGIISALKTGTNNLYQFDKEFGSGNLASALDKITTSVEYLKNAIGASLSSIIIALEPIITKCADALATFFNELSAVGALVSGQNTFKKATKSVKEYAEATEKAKNATLGFDEINTLSNSNSTDYSEMFSEESVSSASEVAKSLAEMLSAVKDIAMNIVEVIKPVIVSLIPILNNLFTSVFAFVADVLVALEPIIFTLTDVIGSIIQSILPLLSMIFSAVIEIINAITPFVSGIIETITPFVDALCAQLAENLQPLLDVLVSVITVAFAVLEKNLPFILSYIQYIVDCFGMWIDVATILFDFLAGNWGKLGEDFKSLGASITDVFGSLWKVVEEWFNMIINSAKVIGAPIVNAFKDAWAKVKDFFTGTVKTFFTETIPNFFKRVGINIVNAIIGGLNKLGNFTIPGLKIGDWQVWGDTTVRLFSIPYLSYATGGFPSQGQLFVANEAGAEMVGSMDGKTAVANNQQIVEGIREGVYDAVVNAMGNSNSNGNYKVDVYLDGKQIASSNSKFRKESGAGIATSGLIYGY